MVKILAVSRDSCVIDEAQNLSKAREGEAVQKNSHAGLFTYIFIGMLVTLSTFEYDFSISFGVLPP
jgi:hypothetical protein